jgi:hypothetical protein
MPAFGKTLTADDAATRVAFIRSPLYQASPPEMADRMDWAQCDVLFLRE